MTVVQPSSAPTSPSHRYHSSSPPSPSPKSPGHKSMGGMSTVVCDPNFLASSLKERNAAMLNNELMADVHFKVGKFYCWSLFLNIFSQIQLVKEENRFMNPSLFLFNVRLRYPFQHNSDSSCSQICPRSWQLCFLCHVLR